MTVRQQMRGARRFGTGAVVVFLAALAAAGLFALVLALVVTSSPSLLRLDRDLTLRLHRYALTHHAFTVAMKTASDVGGAVAWWLILGLLALWLAHRRQWRLVLFAVVTDVGSSLLNQLIKVAVARARPNLPDPVAIAAGKSFPSGHAQSAIVGYGILLAVFLPLIARRWRPPAVTLAVAMVLLIGFSRIALGVHYLSDVVAGYLIGTVWLIGLIAIFRTSRREATGPPG